jgi:hypothetical protein
MYKIISMITALIMSIFLRVSYVVAGSKPLLPGTYYTGNQTTEPDYKAMFAKYQGGSFVSTQKSDKSPQSLSDSEKAVILNVNNQYRWFWAMPQSSVDSLEKDASPITEKDFTEYMKRDSDGTYWFKLQSGTKLLSPGNSYLIPESENAQGLYPSSTYTLGTHIEFVITDTNEAYRVTYGSMLYWWCNMNKTKPDEQLNGDANKPVYGYSVTFSENDRFISGAVVGVAGTSGVPDSLRKIGDSYLSVKIEESPVVNGTVMNLWTPITIQQFYYGG